MIPDILLPLAGFCFCLIIWWSLSAPAKIAGGIWFAIGLAQIAIKSRGFRNPVADISFGEAS